MWLCGSTRAILKAPKISRARGATWKRRTSRSLRSRWLQCLRDLRRKELGLLQQRQQGPAVRGSRQKTKDTRRQQMPQYRPSSLPIISQAIRMGPVTLANVQSARLLTSPLTFRTLAHGLESDEPADQLWEEACGTYGGVCY